jgi:soluble lytic murein transglycosylase-like protein
VPQASWRNLAEMDLRFARSRRRAAVRRREPPPRSPAAWRSVRALLLAALLFGVAGESAREISNARGGPTAPARAVAAVDPACPIPARFRSAFVRAAARTALPLSLLVAMAYTESRMNQRARSHAGANGLLQLMPSTARALDTSWQRADANVLGGARYLRQLLNRFGDLELALAAYNAGPTAVQKAAAAPTLQTLTYVKNVEARAATLAACD